MDKLIINNPLSVETCPGRVAVECEIGKVSDGYHTFDELYEHRCLLFLAWQKYFPSYRAWKSRKHNDGSSFEGWFIAGVDLGASGGQITYHIPETYWDLCRAPERETAPEWDGHTSADVIERLRDWLALNWRAFDYKTARPND